MKPETAQDAVLLSEAREAELDRYEARFGQYVIERGTFDMLQLKIGVQSFPVFWEDNPECSEDVNNLERRWFKRMLCCAMHHLVEEQLAVRRDD